MITIKNYVQPTSLEEALQLLQSKKSNKILGGMLWMRQGKYSIDTAIDLSLLGLNKITETENSIIIGAMVSLRQIETSSLIQTYCPTLLKSVENIVGTQFRNSATIGGSVYSRFGFSDILTALLPLDVEVKMTQDGTLPLEEFVSQPMKKDILESISIPKSCGQASYASLRNTTTDFPIIAVSLAIRDNSIYLSIGARPNKAVLHKFSLDEVSPEKITPSFEDYLDNILEKVVFGTNLRGTGKYRKAVSKRLAEQCLQEVLSCK